MRQKIFLSISLLWLVPIYCMAQDIGTFTIDTLLTYSPEDFSIISSDEQSGSLIQPVSNAISFNYGGLSGEPAIPYYIVSVYHPKETSLVDVQYSTQESLFAESFVMALNQASEPENNQTQPAEANISKDAENTPNNIFPLRMVEVAVEYPPLPQFGQGLPCTVLRVYPFRYDADSELLYLNKQIHIHLIYNSKTNTSIRVSPSLQIVNSNSVNGNFFDLSGRRIGNSSLFTPHSSLPKGVYIKNGRKVVIK